MSYEFQNRREFDQHIEDVRQLRYAPKKRKDDTPEEIIFVQLTGSIVAGCSLADAYYLNGSPAWVGTSRQVLVLMNDLTAPTSPTTTPYRAKYAGRRYDGTTYWGVYVIIDTATYSPLARCTGWAAPCSPFTKTANAKITIASVMYRGVDGSGYIYGVIYSRTQSYIVPFGTNESPPGGPYVILDSAPHDLSVGILDTFTFYDSSGNRPDTYTADILYAVFSCVDNSIGLAYQARVRNYQPFTSGSGGDLNTNWPDPSFYNFTTGAIVGTPYYFPSGYYGVNCNGDGSWSQTVDLYNILYPPGSVPGTWNANATAYLGGFTPYTAYNQVTLTIESQ